MKKWTLRFVDGEFETQEEDTEGMSILCLYDDEEAAIKALDGYTPDICSPVEIEISVVE